MVRVDGWNAADLERLERRLAWQQIRRTLDRLPDRELAQIAAKQDNAALAATGITADLIRAAVGNPEPEELARWMAELFALSEDRRARLRAYLNLEEA